MNIPEKAVEAAAIALDEYWGGRYHDEAVGELSGEMRAVLKAATPVVLRTVSHQMVDLLDSDTLATLADEIEAHA